MLFYFLALIKAITKINNKYLNLIYYYTVTIIAQWVGVYNILTGKLNRFGKRQKVLDNKIGGIKNENSSCRKDM